MQFSGCLVIHNQMDFEVIRNGAVGLLLEVKKFNKPVEHSLDICGLFMTQKTRNADSAKSRSLDSWGQTARDEMESSATWASTIRRPSHSPCFPCYEQKREDCLLYKGA